MSTGKPFHDDICVICIGEQLTTSQETANFCYILNRFILRHYEIGLQPQKPETLVFQRRFDEKYFGRIRYFISTRGHIILTRLYNATKVSTFTEKEFDKLVEIELKNFESVNYNCSCLITYLCFHVAMVGVHFVICGGIFAAKDWAYAHMLRVGGTYSIGGTIAKRELLAETGEKD